MKNITLSVDEKVLEACVDRAAKQNSTINALVREYLTNLAAQENRADSARARLRELSARSAGRLGKKKPGSMTIARSFPSLTANSKQSKHTKSPASAGLFHRLKDRPAG